MRGTGSQIDGCALVTGAGSGIGRATARSLAGRGAAVGIMDCAHDASDETASEIVSEGGQAKAVWGDVSVEEDVARAFGETAAAFGSINIVVACAGVEVLGKLGEIAMDDWNRAIEVNLTGTMLVARQAVQSMLDIGGGAFVAISSDAGVRGSAGAVPYCVSKHGVVGLVRCMAIDYGGRGIRSNVVCPSFVETPMAERIFAVDGYEEREWAAKVPLGRFATPDEIADVVCHLVSDEARYTNGSVYMADGGLTAGL